MFCFQKTCFFQKPNKTKSLKFIDFINSNCELFSIQFLRFIIVNYAIHSHLLQSQSISKNPQIWPRYSLWNDKYSGICNRIVCQLVETQEERLHLLSESRLESGKLYISLVFLETEGGREISLTVQCWCNCFPRRSHKSVCTGNPPVIPVTIYFEEKQKEGLEIASSSDTN